MDLTNNNLVVSSHTTCNSESIWGDADRPANLKLHGNHLHHHDNILLIPGANFH